MQDKPSVALVFGKYIPGLGEYHLDDKLGHARGLANFTSAGSLTANTR
jgi:hypothetical protein